MRIATKFLVVMAAMLTSGAAAAGPDLTISCGAAGQELALCKQGVDEWSRLTGHSVRVVSTPNSPSERLALYQQMLAARAEDIDIFQIDVVWTSMLGAHFVDLYPVARKRLPELFPVAVSSNMVKGRLVSMPWYVEASLLYYRRDLLDRYRIAVPKTWAELGRAAMRIQAGERARGQKGFWGYVFQGKSYEGLTCVALELSAAAGGGSFVESDGRISINNSRSAAAFDLAASWVGAISPSGVLNYEEEDARGVFQGGNAAFMRNWPYAWALANGSDSRVRGRVGVAALPGFGGGQPGTLGGWQLAVSRYSLKPQLAINLVMYLTSRAEQRRRAIVGGYNPTFPDLYDDAAVKAANPFMGSLRDLLGKAVARPSVATGYRYNRVSSVIANGVHGVLAGKMNGKQAVSEIEERLIRVRRGSWSK